MVQKNGAHISAIFAVDVTFQLIIHDQLTGHLHLSRLNINRLFLVFDAVIIMARLASFTDCAHL